MADQGTGIISQVKSSCFASLDKSGIKLSDDGIRAFLTNLDQDEFNKYSEEHGYMFPLKYSDDLDELNFLSILTILNFLSAYRIPLHEWTGQGAYDTIRRFVLSCYLANSPDDADSPMSAQGMANLSEHATADFLKVPILTEKDHPSLPVKIGERTPEAVEVVGLVKKVMNETGRILLAKKAKNLGSYVAGFLNANKALDGNALANALVYELVHTFPAFADEGLVKGQKVKIYKKAQLLTYIIGTAFKGRSNLSFPLPATDEIPACVDNVVPTMAVYFKLIDLSGSVYEIYKNGLGNATAEGAKRKEGIKQTAEEAYAIRAATLAAVERTIELAPKVAEQTGKAWLKNMTSMGLDGYLWSGAKLGDRRNLPRLSERGTVFY